MIDTIRQVSEWSIARRSLLLHVPTVPCSIATFYPSAPGRRVAAVYIFPRLRPRRV